MKHSVHGENNCLGFIEAVINGYESCRSTDPYPSTWAELYFQI